MKRSAACTFGVATLMLASSISPSLTHAAPAEGPRSQVTKSGIPVPADAIVSRNSGDVHISGSIAPSEGSLAVIFNESGLQEVAAEPKEESGRVFAASTYYKGGSSYVKNTERIQLYYEGEAFASGKRDYVVPGGSAGSKIYRVTAACFWYTRDGKTVLSKVCSTTGTNYAPGEVIKKRVKDTLNPAAPKTTFHYDFTVKETG